MDLTTLLQQFDDAVGDARQGVPPELFLLVSRMTPLVNVDLLIQDDTGHTLLTWRDDEHFGTGWHLPGGVIRFKEQATDRIRACARQELGVEVTHEAAPELVMEAIREPEVRGHLVSLLYRCRLAGELDSARRATSEPPAAGQWRWHRHCPPNLVEVQAPYARFFTQP